MFFRVGRRESAGEIGRILQHNGQSLPGHCRIERRLYDLIDIPIRAKRSPQGHGRGLSTQFGPTNVSKRRTSSTEAPATRPTTVDSLVARWVLGLMINKLAAETMANIP